jgi:predicted DNA-binding transcriptional regulator AlpA
MDAKQICSQLEEAMAEIQTSELPMILGELERIKGTILVRIVLQKPQRLVDDLPHQARFLTVDEVVERFHVSAKWLYRHKKQLPHSQASRKVLLFPEKPLLLWFQKRS